MYNIVIVGGLGNIYRNIYSFVLYSMYCIFYIFYIIILYIYYTGDVPTEISGLTNLVTIFYNNNAMSGTLPTELCIASLTKLYFQNIVFDCYMNCLNDVASLAVGSNDRCPTDQDNALCDFIAATDISTKGLTGWTCTGGLPDPTGTSETWTGVGVAGLEVSYLSLESQTITGM